MLAKELRKIINNFVDISAKVVERKKGYGVYLKAGTEIKDILAIMGASQQFFKFDEVMMIKELKTETNRINNLDNANIDKALKAAEKHINAIKKIEEVKGLDFLNAKLKDAAIARLEYPEMGIEELGKTMDPPLSKSGINNRLRKIEEIAKGL
jgi:DNA-binding protein WhiA